MPEGSDLVIPQLDEERSAEGTTLVTARLRFTTRARLVAGCHQEVLDGRDCIDDAPGLAAGGGRSSG
jgi:hypothetical protein